jgi:hypothetical protein
MKGTLNSSGRLNKTTNSTAFSQLPNINKSNVTLWKSKYNQGIGSTNFEEEKNVENDYIENLKKQIYFMEMELKLMKEREKEIEKSGGFSKFVFS